MLKKKTKFSQQIPREALENPYNISVLNGNWFEERFGDKNDKKAISPGICGQSGCLKDKSIYADDFLAPVPSNSQPGFDNYLEWKAIGFRNRLRGEMSNIKIWDSDQFEKNISTTKDVMFNVIPKEREKRGPFNILEKQPKEDLMRPYGNRTTTGLLQWRACEMMREENTPIDMSQYKIAYKKIPLNPNRRTCHGPKRNSNVIISGGQEEEEEK